MSAAGSSPRVTSEELIDALVDARRVELELIEGMAESQMLGRKAHFLEPPIWEMGHVGWFQEYWILRHLDHAATLLPGSDGVYDSFNVSYKLRWDHEYPSRRETHAYISEVLNHSIGRLESREPSAQDVYFYTLGALHEDMHTENLTLILQTLGYARPKLSLIDCACGDPPVNPAYLPHDIAVPGGSFQIGRAHV